MVVAKASTTGRQLDPMLAALLGVGATVGVVSPAALLGVGATVGLVSPAALLGVGAISWRSG